MNHARMVGKVEPGRQLTLTLTLRTKDPGGLAALVKNGATVSPAEFDSRFAPDSRAVQSALSQLRAGGVRATWSPGSALATLDATAGTFERLLQIRFYDYLGAGGRAFYAADRKPVLPKFLRPVTAGLAGLDSYSNYGDRAVRPGGLTPDDVLGFYNIRALRDQGVDGSGETIVMPEIDDLPNSSDLDAYARQFGLAPFNVSVKKDPSWGKPMDVGKVGGEVTLDLEIAHAIAPKARLVAYIGSPRQDLGARLFDQLVRDNPGAIISDSIGACEQEVPSSLRQLGLDQNDRAAAQGMSHFVASGDSGAYDCGPDREAAVDFPSSLPNVTAVGGTTMFQSRQGGYYRESAWGNPISQSGSGGGLSVFYARPDYQAGPGVQNRDSNGKRQLPDVSAVADVNSGWDVVIGGRQHEVGGTSAAAPLWAGITALINQALKKKNMRRVGFANPALYWMGQNDGKFPVPPFHDVTQGNNLRYDAGGGWDYGTGWGTMDAVGLEAAFESYIKQGGR